MDRKAFSFLKSWLNSSDRKPLVIRGARQVGKTWLARTFAKQSQKVLVEFNFEKTPSHATLFQSNNPQEIIQNIRAFFGRDFKAQETLLFLDEIQAAPELFSKLRWFSEELPELTVIATGSLLELILGDPNFSMPVGRISYLHLEPMSFEEFLQAQELEHLVHDLMGRSFMNPVPQSIHDKLLSLFKEYMIVGGMPAVVKSWVLEKSINKVSQIQADLISTYQSDFSKYRTRIAVDRIDEILMAIPRNLGQKINLSKIHSSICNFETVKKILKLLSQARVCHRVSSCSANGVPLGSEVNDKHFKEIFLDVGLCSNILGLNLSQVKPMDDLMLVNSGAIAEQVVGQLLRTIEPFYLEPKLYYWLNMESNAQLEVDYVIQHYHQIIPVEVKAGSSGKLRSLHRFMQLKNLPRAIRVYSGNLIKTEVRILDHQGSEIQYELLSIPFYLTEQIHRLLG